MCNTLSALAGAGRVLSPRQQQEHAGGQYCIALSAPRRVTSLPWSTQLPQRCVGPKGGVGYPRDRAVGSHFLPGRCCLATGFHLHLWPRPSSTLAPGFWALRHRGRDEFLPEAIARASGSLGTRRRTGGAGTGSAGGGDPGGCRGGWARACACGALGT
jgi:hypothetical protein